MSSTGFNDATNAVIVQALNDGIASSPEGLSVRQIIPALDLLDANRQTIVGYDWKQVHTTENQDELIYGGIRDGDEKVIAISAIMGLGTTLWTNTIRFDKGTSVAQLVDVQMLAIQDESISHAVRMYSPVIYKKNQGLRIYFNTKSGATGQTDNLMLVGCVAEPVGSYMTG